MFYFINEYLLPKNSSVEHSAMDRVKLFNHYQTPAKIVTKMYDRLLHQTLATFNLPDEQVLNMFDYFQQATTVLTQVYHVEELQLPVEYAVEVGANFSRIFNGDELVGNVGFIPGTIGRVFYQEFLDNQGNRMATDLWDWRGFKSCTQYFGQNGKLTMERYYTPAGKIAIEQYFVPDTEGNPLASRLILKDYQDQGDRFFQNTTALFNFFIAELSHRDTETTTFINDRPGTGIQPLLQLNDDSKKYVMVPIYHAKTLNDPLHAPLDGFLEPALDNAPHFDGFITSTNQQAQHLQTRFSQAKVTQLPVVATTALNQSQLVPMSQRAKQLLYVGRLAPDRQIDHLIRVVALVKQQIPTIQFDLYGYGDTAYCETLTALIDELDLTTNVHLMGYQPDLAQRYTSYQLLLNAALANGGPMAMPEAMAQGLPVISYRFNYGPHDFINDGQDGYIVEPGDQLAMSTHITDLLTDEKQLAKFSAAAFNKLHTDQTYLKVWHQWQQVLGLKNGG
ncbi:poly(glycerol-phosphate) alpha-glucosyltransferase [Lactobacillus sp. CBA3606]|uniref:glycosyltransferase n=1 Tax=Lactobacillus sp. CBA3606 TaxID=2099789 RepID=UPI000CFB6C0E|nr:glycosyltransferase [Lactobacillus sp. CBA3606]AVK64132.1 poly(glycerol-phosphate) alpha-glucosyltransferase [Lactobacillus sp. CBA3606]